MKFFAYLPQFFARLCTKAKSIKLSLFLVHHSISINVINDCFRNKDLNMFLLETFIW